LIPINYIPWWDNNQYIFRIDQVYLDDGVCILEPFEQTTGVAQGDNLSPLLFSVLLSDLPETIRARHPHVHMILYADDLVLYSQYRAHLQQALATLETYVNAEGMAINMMKTEAMKFRRGGKLAREDQLQIGGEKVDFTSRFTYLGIVLSTTAKSFSAHVRERVSRALIAARSIRDPWKLSLRAALQIFDMKVGPVASYGIQLIWPYLNENDMRQLERVKPTFLKRVMGLHISTPNRLIYKLAETRWFLQELKTRYHLQDSSAYSAFIEERAAKEADIHA